MNRTKTSDSIKPWVRTLLILPAFIVIVGLFQLAGSLVLGFGLFVLVALAEELLLRGYVLNNLMM